MKKPPRILCAICFASVLSTYLFTPTYAGSSSLSATSVYSNPQNTVVLYESYNSQNLLVSREQTTPVFPASQILVASQVLPTARDPVTTPPKFKEPLRPIRIYVNSQPLPLTLPILCDVQNQRTLYPFRQLLESIGAVVSYESATKTAIADYNGTVLRFPQESSTYYVDGQARSMDTKTTSDPRTSRTYVPIRYAFEALGFGVLWVSSQLHDEIRVYDYGEYSVMSDEEFVQNFYKPGRTSTRYYKLVAGGGNSGGDDQDSSVNQDNSSDSGSGDSGGDRSDSAEETEDDSDSSEQKNDACNTEDLSTNTGHLVFSDGGNGSEYSGVVLDSPINPHINRQVYELVKVLADENQFVLATYSPYYSEEFATGAYVIYSRGESQAFLNDGYFDFLFFENKGFDARSCFNVQEFTDNAAITLILRRLYWNLEEGEFESFYPYEKKLRDSFIAIFGSDTGRKIFEFVFSIYIRERASEDPRYYLDKKIHTSKDFGNIHIDYIMDTSHLFYFSYIN